MTTQNKISLQIILHPLSLKNKEKHLTPEVTSMKSIWMKYSSSIWSILELLFLDYNLSPFSFHEKTSSSSQTTAADDFIMRF